MPFLKEKCLNAKKIQQLKVEGVSKLPCSVGISEGTFSNTLVDRGIPVRISEKFFRNWLYFSSSRWLLIERIFQNRLKKHPFPLQISEGIKNFLSKRVCIWASPVGISRGAIKKSRSGGAFDVSLWEQVKGK